jgi:hypothetical protein
LTGGALLLLMLLVSWTSLVLQGAALIHLWRQHATGHVERLAGRGYTRTASCRVLAASVYCTVALLAVLGVHIPGAGTLSPEALCVFTGVQAIWLTNAALDVRLRKQLRA